MTDNNVNTNAGTVDATYARQCNDTQNVTVAGNGAGLKPSGHHASLLVAHMAPLHMASSSNLLTDARNSRQQTYRKRQFAILCDV